MAAGIAQLAESLLGDDAGVTGLRIRSTKDKSSTTDLVVDGIFIAIGHLKD